MASVFVWLRATTFDRVGAPSTLAVADVYAGVERELLRGAGVYQATIDVSSHSGISSYHGTITRWVDVRRDSSREEWNMAPIGSSAMITTPDGRFARDGAGRITTSPSRYSTCNGVGIAASAVLGCPGPTERSTAEVREGTRDGRPAVVLITTGSVSGSDETYTFTRRLYLDRSTYLPLALEGDGQMDFGKLMPARERYGYQHRFVPIGALAKDLFDPGSIGYAASDPAQMLDRSSTDMQTYWLGQEFARSSALPAVVLSKIDAPEHGPGYRYLLHYALRDDRFAPSLATLQLWPRSAWDAVWRGARFGNVWDDPCWSREELALPNGRAAILSGFANEFGRAPVAKPAEGPCPSSPYDTFLAHVYLADTVVFVSAPRTTSGGTLTKSPYDTREGMEALVRGLRQH